MDIQTEAQAAKVRAVMQAMIGKIQAAKEAGDKPALQELRSQYTTLQTALQEYKAKDTPPEQPETPSAPPSDELTELRRQLEAAQATIQNQRTIIGSLKYDMEILRDEVRTLRSPPTPEERKRVQTITQGNQPAVPPEFWGGLFDELKPSTPKKVPANSEENT